MESNSKCQDFKAIDYQLKSEKEVHTKLEKQLNEAQLAADGKALESSSLLSSMGHEIRTPMNSIIGMTSILLEDESLSPDQKEFLETIKVSGDALMEILNDILDFSRLECKKLKLNLQPFELRSFVEETLSLIAIDAARKGLILSHRFNGAVPDCIVQDRKRLGQILFILLDNSVKCTDRGEIRLNISSREVQGGQEVHFSVQDTGMGISPDVIDALFLPFGEKDPHRIHKYGGSGLGLAICKGLVELMEGKIWAESIAGIGSTFHFIIKEGEIQT